MKSKACALSAKRVLICTFNIYLSPGNVDIVDVLEKKFKDTLYTSFWVKGTY